MMKKIIAVVMSLAVLATSLAVSASALKLEYTEYSRDVVASRFKDVAGWEWFVPALGNAGIAYGLIKGSADGEGNVRFYPYRNMTREQFTQVLYRIDNDIMRFCFGKSMNDKGTSSFSDVDASAWYAKSVVWAENEGVVEGLGDGTFGIDKAISREAVAAMLRRYLTARPYIKIENGNNEVTFNDSADISDWAREDVEWAVKNGLFVGDEKGMFLPQKQLTRAEATQLIERFYTLLDYDLNYIFDAEHIEKITYVNVYSVTGIPESRVAIADDAESIKAICEKITNATVVELKAQSPAEILDGAYWDTITVNYNDGRDTFEFDIWNSYLYCSMFRTDKFEDGFLENELKGMFDFSDDNLYDK